MANDYLKIPLKFDFSAQQFNSTNLSYRISNLPLSASLSAGELNSDGQWVLSQGQLDKLYLQQPDTDVENMSFQLSIFDDSQLGDSVVLFDDEVIVNLNVFKNSHSIDTEEDIAVDLELNEILTENGLARDDVNELLISNVPDNGFLSVGEKVGANTWRIDGSDINDIELNLPPHLAGDINLGLSLSQMINDQIAISNLALRVAAVADDPIISVAGQANPDSQITLRVSGDHYQGEPLMQIYINGEAVGGVQKVTAEHSQGEWQLIQLSGDYGINGPESISVEFLNDRWDGPDKDRNLVVEYIEVNGQRYAPEQARYERAYGMSEIGGREKLAWSGKLTFNTSDSSPFESITAKEDEVIALDLNVALADTDGSEKLTEITISNLPEGSRLSAGALQSDGSYRLTADDLAGLKLTPPADYSGEFILSLSAISKELLNNDTATSQLDLPIVVESKSDGMRISVNDIAANEDQVIPINLQLQSHDRDGSEQIEDITISGVPEGASLSAGEYLGNGVWSLTVGQLSGLSLTTAKDTDDDVSLTISVNSRDAGAAQTITNTATLNIGLEAKADGPQISVDGASNESEVLLRVSGHHYQGEPRFKVFIDDEQFGDIFTVSADCREGEFEDVVLRGDFGALGPDNISIEFLNDHYGGSVERDRDLIVDYIEVNNTRYEAEQSNYIRGYDQASLSGYQIMHWGGTLQFNTQDSRLPNALYGKEDTSLPLNIDVALNDVDGSERLLDEILIIGLPDGVSLSAGELQDDGSYLLNNADLEGLVIIPTDNFKDNFELTIQATSQESSNADQAITQLILPIHFEGLADAPGVQIQVAQGKEDQAIALDITVALTDAKETISDITISGVPEGAQLSAGNEFSPGEWYLTVEQLEGLTITPPENSDEDFSLNIAVTSSEPNSDSNATTLVILPVMVDAIADAPLLQSPQDLSSVTFRISGSNIGNGMPEFAGPPEFNIYINGEQVGGTYTALADFSEGHWDEFTLYGDWGVTGPDTVEVEFTNDLWCAPFCADRDLLVDRIEVNHTPYEAEDALYLRYAINADLGHECDPEVVAANIAAGLYEASTGTLPEMLTSGQERMAWEGRLIFDTRNNGGPQIVQGDEDTAIRVPIALTLLDTDGSESVSHVLVSDIPAGAILSAGEQQEDGSWRLTIEEISQLRITPPEDSDADFEINVTAVSVENANGDQASQSITVPIAVHAVADKPDVAAAPASGQENQAIALDIQAALTDVDSSETLHIVIANVPAGAILSAGELQNDGTWVLSSNQLDDLTITPPLNSDNDFVLSVSAVSTEASNQDQAQDITELPVTITGTVNKPTLSHDVINTAEDVAIALELKPENLDTDGSESLTISISGLPEGASLSAGEQQADNSWSLTLADLAGLQLFTAEHSDQDFNLTVSMTAIENSTGEYATTIATIPVTVAAVADAPRLTLPGSDGQSEINVRVSGDHYLGAPRFRVHVDGEPFGDVITVAADRRSDTWETITLKGDFGPMGPESVTVEFLNDRWGGSREHDRNLVVDYLEVNGQHYAPDNAIYDRAYGMSTIDGQKIMAWTGEMHFDTANNGGVGVRGYEDQSIALDISTALVDRDGSESLQIQVDDVPAGATLSAGSYQGDGRWLLNVDDLNDLSITPPLHSDTDFQIVVNAISTETENGHQAITTLAIPIEVKAVADKPSLTAAVALGTEDQAVNLLIDAALVDQDGSESLSVIIDNVPAGASLSAGSQQADGSWQLSPDQLAGLQLQPPANNDVNFELTVTAVSTEQSNTDSATTQVSLPVQLTAVADAPALIVENVSGQEDAAIELNISSTLIDTDGSESMQLLVSGVPAGMQLSAGTPLEEAVPSILNAETTLHVAEDYTAKVIFEGETAGYRNSFGYYTIDADTGKISDVNIIWENASLQGSGGDLQAGESSVDIPMAAGTEMGFFIVANGFSQNNFEGLSDGEYQFLDADGNQAAVDSDKPTLWYVSESGETIRINGHIYHTTQNEDQFELNPDGMQHTTALLSLEDCTITIGFEDLYGGGDRDFDDSIFTLMVGLENTQAIHTQQVTSGDTTSTWLLSADDLANLSIMPLPDYSGEFALQITSSSTEASNGDRATVEQSITVNVNAVADEPTVTITPAAGYEDQAVSLHITTATNDMDGSESIQLIHISDVPVGATLSQGRNNGDGSWTLGPDELTGLSVTPPLNSNVDFVLNITAISEEPNGSQAASSVALPVTLTGVADQAVLNLANVQGNEDSQIALDIQAVLTDIDNSEDLSVQIDNVPSGAQLSAGQPLGNGQWLLTAEQLNELTITPPPNSDSNFTLTVTAISQENDGDSASISQSLSVTVSGVADKPYVTVEPASGLEDQAININIAAALSDTDGSEGLLAGAITIANVPAGASLSAGVPQGDGVWILNPSELEGLQITPALNSNTDFVLDIRVFSTESSGDTVSTQIDLPVSVQGVADQPLLSASDIVGQEDKYINLEVDAALQDIDGSETLSFVISDLPSGAKLNTGVENNDGSWTLSADQISNAAIKPPGNFSGEFTLNIVAVATENDGDSANVQTDFAVNVTAVTDTARIKASTVNAVEDTTVPLNLNISLRDKDGSETLGAIVISQLPTGAILSAGQDNGDGSWTLTAEQIPDLQITPPANSNDDFRLKVSAETIEETVGSRITNKYFDVKLTGVADTPLLEVADVSGFEDRAISLDVEAALLDTDNSESLSIIIRGVPRTGSLSHGSYQGDGVWEVDPADLAQLQINAPQHFSGRIDLEMIASSHENDGDIAIVTAPFSVFVEGVADIAHMEVRPANGFEDQAIALDIRTQLVDTDGSEGLSVLLGNIPQGAQLSAGELQDDGRVLLNQDQLNSLTITPPAHSNVDFILTVTALSSEQDGHIAQQTQALPVSVIGIADQPLAIAENVSGYEDQPIALSLSADLIDSDGSETLSIVIGGLPVGARISHGLFNGNGTWSIDPEELGGLTITPPRDFSGDIAMTMRVISTEDDGDISQVTLPFNVHVTSVVDAPSGYSVARGLEDTAISLNLNPGLNDHDGSESVIEARISGVPEGAELSAGTEIAAGVYLINQSDLSDLTITPPYNSNENFVLNVVSTILESDGVIENYSGNLQVKVRGVADLPSVVANDISGDKNTAIALDFHGRLSDFDGSEELYYILENVPQDTFISAGFNNGDGSWTILPEHLSALTLTPPVNYTGELDLVVRAVARESDGDLIDNTTSFTLQVLDVGSGDGAGSGLGTGDSAHAIRFDNISTYEDQPIHLDLSELNDSQVNSITLIGIPAGATLSNGELQADGSWSLTTADIQSDLSLSLVEHSDPDFPITVSWHDHDEQYMSEFSVQVLPQADAPILTVQAVTGIEDTAIALNVAAELVDLDGSEVLSYIIKDLPEGADLSAGFYNPANSTWTLTVEELEGLAVMPPAQFSGDLSFTFGAVATEYTGNYAINTQTVVIPVTAVADPAVIKAQPEVVIEDNSLALNLNITSSDQDGSESIQAVTISNLPAGAQLLGATANADGSYSITMDELANLRVQPPAHQHGQFSLTVTAITQEANGDSMAVSKEISFHVLSAPDEPALQASNVQGFEDSAIALNINASLNDQDGSEVMSVIVSGIPEGAVLSAGMNNGDGTWTLRAEQLSGLSMTPPLNFSGAIALTVQAISLEMDTFETAETLQSFNVNVTPLADAPTADPINAVGLEDAAIPVIINAQLTDTDGSEALTVIFNNVPAGAQFSAGTKNADGSWLLSAEQLSGLTITPPNNVAEDFQLALTVIATESNGEQSVITDTLDIQVTPQADAALITANDISGREDMPIMLDLDAELFDIDGSESLILSITGVPDTASLSHGLRNADGSWSVAEDDLPLLVMTPPEHFSGQLNMTLIATTTDNNGDTNTISKAFAVTLEGQADAASLTLNQTSGLEDYPVPLDVVAMLVDIDGSESLQIHISDLPDGASLSAGEPQADGRWLLSPGELSDLRFNPPANFSGAVSLSIVVSSLEQDGDRAEVNDILTLQVAPVIDEAIVSVHDVHGREDQAIALDLSAALFDDDGSESISLLLIGVPAGAVLSAGTQQADGQWLLGQAELNGLSFTPPANLSGEMNMALVVTVNESAGEGSLVSSHPFSVTVAGDADTPLLAVAENTNSDYGQPVLLDVQAALSDIDGSENLHLRIEGLPAGASLSAGQANPDGSWEIVANNINGLALTPPAEFSGAMQLSFTATTEDFMGDTVSISSNMNIQVAEPVIEIVEQNRPLGIFLDIETQLQGFDDTAALDISIQGIPDGGMLSAGIDNGDGSWSLDSTQLSDIHFVPPEDYEGVVRLTLEAVATDTDGSTASASSTMNIPVGNNSEQAFEFSQGRGHETYIANDGAGVIRLEGVIHGPVSQIDDNDDWVLLLEPPQGPFEQAENSLNFSNDTSGVISLADGSSLEFYDVTRVEW